MVTVLVEIATEMHAQLNQKVEASPISEGKQPIWRMSTTTPVTTSKNPTNKRTLCINPSTYMQCGETNM